VVQFEFEHTTTEKVPQGPARQNLIAAKSLPKIDHLYSGKLLITGPATTGRIQVGEMLVHEGAEAYKQEGRAQGHAAPGRQAEGQGQTPMIWAG
jgi:hypothetical protein